MKTIVCGAGRVGGQISRRLAAEGTAVTVVDNSDSAVQATVEASDVEGIVGFASHPDVLERAGARDASMIIAATQSDEVNMMVCQVAYSLYSIPQKIARIRSHQYLHPSARTMFRSTHMPVDDIIYPERDVAEAIIHWFEAPVARDVMPFLDDHVRFVRIGLGEDCPVLETPLRELSELFEGLHAVVLSMQRGDEMRVASSEDELKLGDEVRFVVPTSQLGRTLGLFGQEILPVRNLLVVGGGNIGATVAELAAQREGIARLRVIERERTRAAAVSSQIPKSVVLLGDALNPEIFHEARADLADVVVAVTNDERVNLLSCALAKDAGARRTLALVTSDDMRPVARRLGIDSIINPEAATVSSILRHIRRGSIQAIHTVPGHSGDVLEATVHSTAPIEGKKLGEAGLPEGSRLGAVLRADGTLKEVGGELKFENGDRIILLAQGQDMRKVEALLQVSASFF